MPKSSPEGSVFPGLEQEQRSEPHPKHPQITVKKQTGAENSKKTKKSDVRES